MILNVLQKRPEYGIASAFMSSFMDTQHVWQFVGIVLGVLIAIVTLILKLIELREKFIKKKIERQKTN
jgi:MFS superfamily sulfate permease-like transporter